MNDSGQTQPRSIPAIYPLYRVGTTAFEAIQVNQLAQAHSDVQGVQLLFLNGYTAVLLATVTSSIHLEGNCSLDSHNLGYKLLNSQSNSRSSGLTGLFRGTIDCLCTSRGMALRMS